MVCRIVSDVPLIIHFSRVFPRSTKLTFICIDKIKKNKFYLIINFNSKHHDQCKFAFELIKIVTISNQICAFIRTLPTLSQFHHWQEGCYGAPRSNVFHFAPPPPSPRNPGSTNGVIREN